MTNRLSEYLVEPEGDVRLERIWQNIESRKDEYRPSLARQRAVVVGGALAVAAGVLFGWFVGAPWGEPSGHQVAVVSEVPQLSVGAKMRTGAEEISVNLADGSLVTLAPRSSVALQETHSANVALNLEEGRVVCHVSKEKGRVFSVLAGEVTVRVLGTQFSVERLPVDTGEKVMVEVREGVVEVEGPDGVGKRLSAGESWSVRVKSDTQRSVADSADTNEELSEVAKQAISKKDEPRSLESARDLFAEARAARNAGDAALAVRLYQRFLNQHSKDPRAGVAALEVGRLRMDELGDVSGAIAPLARAARSAGSGLGDDALARLVRAHAQLGQVSSCQSARARYLKSYPQGVHVEQVQALCP